MEKITGFVEEQVEKRMKQEKHDQEKAVKLKMQNFVNAINSHLKSVAPLILKGCSISCESYKKLRLLMSFVLKEERAVVSRCQLPKIAFGSLKAMYVRNEEVTTKMIIIILRILTH